MEKENKESTNRSTEEVLKKWGVEGEMNDEDIRNAASSFVRIRVKNTIMKWVAVGGVLFIATFIGLMMGSVILGLEATKDFKVKDEVLLQNNENSTTLGTSEAFYSFNLKLTTPLTTIKGIKSLKFSSSGGTLQFNVVSFYYIFGKTLTFYGVNHVAEVMPDGTVDVYPITSTNGARSIDEEKRDTYTETSATGELSFESNGFYDINQCSDLLLMEEDKNYQMVTSLECTLIQPLFSLPGQAYRGFFNGNGHTLSLSIIVNGPAALFGSLNKATIINLLLRGKITGVQNCGGVAVETYPGTNFVSNGVYVNVTCTNNGNGDPTTIGIYSSLLRNPFYEKTPILFETTISQGNLTISLSDANLPNFQGGFYGLALETVSTNFTFSYSATIPRHAGGSYKADPFGFKYVPSNSNSDKRDVYVPEDCYGYNHTDPQYINMCAQFCEENAYRNPCCCSCFDACYYINCANKPDVKQCPCCRHDTKRNVEAKGEYDSKSNIKRSSGSLYLVELVPTVQKLCPKRFKNN
eukprot:TRINITY_DN1574_c0_g3_i1.p1 TRINITY_DN1574_c0_g3~~TRINITY_DN1574_c0_g3_i1.p1  ORF type:complete len:523 (+),score=151.81 TRINITY_DN1574_c0_g3_i1:125-1693(+)